MSWVCQWLPFSLLLWPLVQKSSLDIMCWEAHKADGPLVSQLCVALSKHSKRPQPWAVECPTWPSSCSYPSRQVLAHFTYLCAQSRPGKLPTISRSPLRLGSCSPFPGGVGAPYPHSLHALSSLPLLLRLSWIMEVICKYVELKLYLIHFCASNV